MKPKDLILTGDYKRDVQRLSSHAKDVSSILSGQAFATRDQFSTQVYDLTIDTAVTSDLRVSFRERPISVELVAAYLDGDQSGVAVSGGSVSWEWRGGAVRLHSFSALAAATRYNATILVRR